MSWPVASLADVATINPRVQKDQKLPNNVTFLPMAAVSEEGAVVGAELRPLEEVRKGFTYFERGDVLLAKITPCFENGKATFLDRLETQVGFGSTEFHVIRPDEKQLDGKFLFYLLWNAKFRHEGELNMTGSAGQRRVPTAFLERYTFTLPPLATQKHIARVLEQADQLRKQAQQMESELNQLAQSLFLEMFGDPVTNPKRWTTAPYADLCHRITVGIVVRPTDYYVDDGVPALRSLNVRENRIIKENFVYFSEANNVGPLQKTRVYKGDVVLVRSGQPGTAAVVPEELDGVNAIDILISTPNQEKVASNYLAFFFNSSGGKKIVGASERGQIQKHLNVGSLENALIPVPPLALQEEFVRRLDAIANVRRNAEVNLESINMTFDSLMQRAFNGELTAPQRKAA